jgi:hypothetical protein
MEAIMKKDKKLDSIGDKGDSEPKKVIKAGRNKGNSVDNALKAMRERKKRAMLAKENENLNESGNESGSESENTNKNENENEKENK